MENKTFYLAWLSIIPGLGLIEFEQLNELIINAGWGILLSNWILIPTFLLIALSVLIRINRIAQYTDESMPVKMVAVSIILCLIGMWIPFPRLIILGIIGIILSAYWSRGTVYQYY